MDKPDFVKKDLRLTSYFSLVTIPVMLLAIVVLVFIYRLVVLESLQRQVEQNNITVTKSLSNVIWEQIRVLELTPDTKESWALNEIYVDVITQDIYKYLHGTPVLKVKVFNTDGKTVYSTNKDEIGEQKPEDYDSQVAVTTRSPISRLSHRETFKSIDGTLTNVKILATYIPKYVGEMHEVGQIPEAEGVFEIFTDITEPVKNINGGLFNFTIILIFVFAFVYAALYALVRNADKIISENKDDLKQKIIEVEKMNLVLEENAKELAIARDMANHANLTKSQFLANMSHELRTPLNAIIGYTELITESINKYDDEEINSDLAKVHGAGKHLLELIDGILDLSKIEAGQMELHREAFGVQHLLHEVIDTIKPILKKNHNEIKLVASLENIVMFGDMQKIRQILFNLISNSAKFTKDGTISLVCRMQSINNDRKIIFEVSDTGIGIPPEHISKLFDPFEQGDTSTTRKYGGTGLGLTITKRFCTMMDGEIEVDSVPGKGTKFIVYIPYIDASPIAKEAV